MSDVTLRIVTATDDDVAVILRMIRALAAYERLSHKVLATEQALRDHLFGPGRVAEAVIAHADHDPVGFAVFFPTFSTFAGRPRMYLEDLFVEAAWRRHGFGRRLLAHVAAVAAERGCDRLSWSVLRWNAPAIEFYRGLGAEPIDDWQGFTLVDEAFRKLGQGVL